MLTDPATREAEQDYARAVADAAERVKIQWAIADRTLQAITFANGGAIIALFTFVGNVAAKGGSLIHLDLGGVRWAFLWFVLGLGLALLAHLLAFMSQDRFYNQSMRESWRAQRRLLTGEADQDLTSEQALNRQGFNAYWIGLGAAFVAIALFVAGATAALFSVR